MGHGSIVDQLIPEDSPQRQEPGDEPRSNDSLSEQDGSKTELMPRGPTYPLNSKHVKAGQLQRIAASLGLPTTGTAAVTRQLIEGKLMETEREPKNAQVIIQDTSENSAISLIDQNGIICVYKPRERVTHVSQPVDTRGEDPLDKLSSALRVKGSELAALRETVDAQERELQETYERLRQVQEDLDNERHSRQQQSEELRESEVTLEKEKRKVKRIWQDKCEIQLSHEDEIDTKDVEIARLKARLLVVISPSSPHLVSDDHSHRIDWVLPLHRRGKVPPINPFSAEGSDEHWDDLLPTFERAAEWNNCSDSECLLQLAGHLRSKARQEFSVNTRGKVNIYYSKTAMRSRPKVGSKTLAAQEFRHATQGPQEVVSDYILRLEKTFRRAYGQDHMAKETRSALLYAQLQEGLKYALMKAPAVSGAQRYQKLCVAVKNEERHLNELNKRQQYLRDSTPESATNHQHRRRGRFGHNRVHDGGNPVTVPQGKVEGSSGLAASIHSVTNQKRCYICNSTNHLANQCRSSRTESTGKPPRNPTQPATRQVIAESSSAGGNAVNPLNMLLSDPEDDTVRQIRITDQGSEAQSAKVEIHGVPAHGIIDTAADITIMGDKLFKEVASVARLKKKDFRPADKIPRTYNRQPFSLDGWMDLDVTFGDKTMQTPVYIKMDAPDQLLLSEGVCRQLSIVTYHKDVCSPNGDRHTNRKREGVKLTTRVNMIRTIHLLPHQSIAVQVKIDPSVGNENLLLMECDSDL